MKPTEMEGIFRENNKIFTENLDSCRGIKIYNERLLTIDGREFRSWNPYRSKLAAAILKGMNIDIDIDSNVLYLGAATGTTVSHISDIVKNGLIYAVEVSPIAVNSLTKICEKRYNIIPILADANHPDRYSFLVPSVNLVYQDISQRNQTEIFIENIDKYMTKDGKGILMIKARSIDVSLKPKDAYEAACLQLEDHGLNIVEIKDLSPYEKDHVAIIVSR